MKMFIKLPWLIFVTSCAINTQSPNNALNNCDIIYGHTSDWNVISDDLVRNIYEHNLNCESLLKNY